MWLLIGLHLVAALAVAIMCALSLHFMFFVPLVTGGLVGGLIYLLVLLLIRLTAKTGSGV